MKKRKTLTRLLCATVSVATVAAVGGMALADETDVVEVEEPAEIVEEQPDAEEADPEREEDGQADIGPTPTPEPADEAGNMPAAEPTETAEALPTAVPTVEVTEAEPERPTEDESRYMPTIKEE